MTLIEQLKPLKGKLFMMYKPKPLFITIALLVEGRTDERFLPRIIRRTLEDIIESTNHEVEFSFEILYSQKKSFRDKVEEIQEKISKIPNHILCIHKDADRFRDDLVRGKIMDTKKAWENKKVVSTNIVPIVPITETEAWLLADWNSLWDEVDSLRGKKEPRPKKLAHPEKIRNPKEEIEDLIQKAWEKQPRKRKCGRVTLAALYEPLGNKICLIELARLSAYQKFERDLRKAYETIQAHEVTI